MASLTLVVMAAGIGSRYGGLKQIDPIGPGGEIVIDYSIFDALKAGFDKVVFIIRKDFREAFVQKVGRIVESRVETAYVFQEMDALPAGYSIPPGRIKPWGTAQAVLACREKVATPFAAINADDFYGRTAFAALAAHMKRTRETPGLLDFSMVGYILENTLSEHGHVARGVCEITPDHYLKDIRERVKIQKFADGVKYTEDGRDWVLIPPGSFVSMNMWGFTPGLFAEIESRFPTFLEANAGNILKAEFLIPEVVGGLVREKRARVKVLPTEEKWFGVTYPEDKPRVQEAVRKLIREGLYPERLWEG
jgi:hypothetical protein